MIIVNQNLNQQNRQPKPAFSTHLGQPRAANQLEQPTAVMGRCQAAKANSKSCPLAHEQSAAITRRRRVADMAGGKTLW